MAIGRDGNLVERVGKAMQHLTQACNEAAASWPVMTRSASSAGSHVADWRDCTHFGRSRHPTVQVCALEGDSIGRFLLLS
jgi:hypothetical protein